ncbi:YraN family protein [Patescibacteria group bacterium]|nr:YraN family protein [Patescibacteria group bacterium]
MASYKQKIGKKGEGYVAEYLISAGCDILAENYFTRFGEVDIVASSGHDADNFFDRIELVFVEVKTRSDENFDFAEETVSPKKRRSFEKTVYHYLDLHDWRGPIRMDLICVILGKDNMVKSLQHVKDI